MSSARPDTSDQAVNHVGVAARKPSAFNRFLTGLMAFSIGVFICGACGSYMPSDPSLNSATDGPINNLFGSGGAVTADLLTQTFGWTAWMAGFGLMAGGLRRTFAIGPRRAARWVWGVSAIVFSGVCLAAWPIPANWPLASDTGLGGVAGERILYLISRPFAALGFPAPENWAASICGLGAVISAAVAMGLNSADVIAVIRTVRQYIGAISHATKPVMAGGQTATSGPVSASDEADANENVNDLKERASSFFENMSSRKQAKEPAVDVEPVKAMDPAQFTVEEKGVLKRVEDTTQEAQQRARDLAQAQAPKFNTPAPSQPTLPLGHTAQKTQDRILPGIDLLNAPPPRRSDIDEQRLLEMADELQIVLNDFGVKGRITEVRPGPVVTLFELEPAPGTKSSRVIALAEDIARSMSATSARVAVVPGRNAIGIELPNPDRETVYLRDLLAAQSFRRTRASLPMALGETIGGEPTVADLAKMPHLLIAGTTGSGKSVGINAMILSLLYKLSPEECRFIMIDPKMLELSIYEGIPHLLAPVVIDPQKAVAALKWVVREMESRYEVMAKMGVRNISGFNAKAKEARDTGEVFTRPVQTGYDKDTGEPTYENEIIDMRHMPHIVVVIDEMADLMIVAGKEIEALVQRLAQMARAAGIHLITATQRPSVDVITGTIKANFPTRISYMVTTKIDSRTILGEQGAEQLLGQGDLLYQASGGRLQRLHGPFVSDEEVESIVSYLKSLGEPDYIEGITDDVEEDQGSAADNAFGTSSGDPEEDLYREAVAIVRRDKRASTSYVQRRLKIGYNRAASIIERMEQDGVISAPNHAGKREILGDDGGSNSDAA